MHSQHLYQAAQVSLLAKLAAWPNLTIACVMLAT